MGAPSAPATSTNATTTLKKPVAASSAAENSATTSCSTYLSLVQQYLAVFQLENAAWLAERCVAAYPENQEAVYLQALCHYRAGKPKQARQCLQQQQQAGGSSTTTTAALFLMAQCAYELGEYSRGETCLLKDAVAAHKQATREQQQAATSLDEWILQTTVRRLACVRACVLRSVFHVG